MNENCTVVVNSCDKYEDAWYPFFELVKKHWKDCKYPFVLNTETKQYDHVGINLISINGQNEDDPWGKRLINVLKKIESKYVILLLEDFFLLGTVNQDEIEKCLHWMKMEEDIAAIYFKKITGYNDLSNDYPGYIEMKENKVNKLNCQAALWNKEILISLIHPDETPWEFEEIGYKRIEGRDLKFFCSSVGSHYSSDNNVFNYLVARNFGYGIWQGKWLWNNNKLFEKNGIKIGDIRLEKMRKFEYLAGKIKNKITIKIKQCVQDNTLDG